MADPTLEHRFKEYLMPARPGRCSAPTHGWSNDADPIQPCWMIPTEKSGKARLENIRSMISAGVQNYPYLQGGNILMAAVAAVSDTKYVILACEEYEKLKARVSALESAMQRVSPAKEPPRLTPEMERLALAVSENVFGKATIEPSEEGDHFLVRVLMRADTDPSDRAKMIAKWLRDLRTASPELVGGILELDLDFE